MTWQASTRARREHRRRPVRRSTPPRRSSGRSWSPCALEDPRCSTQVRHGGRSPSPRSTPSPCRHCDVTTTCRHVTAVTSVQSNTANVEAGVAGNSYDGVWLCVSVARAPHERLCVRMNDNLGLYGIQSTAKS